MKTIAIYPNCGCSFVSDGGDICPICFRAAGLAVFLERLRNLWYDVTHPRQAWRERGMA